MLKTSKELLEELEKSAYIKRAEYHRVEDKDDASGIWIELDERLKEDLDYDVIGMGLSDERLTAESIYNAMGKYESGHCYVGGQCSKNLDILILFVKTVGSFIISLIVLILSTSSVFGLSFSDVNESDWFYDNVVSAVNQGYISGYEDNSFKPNKEVSHGEFYAMLCRAAGVDSIESPRSHWASPYADALYYQGNRDISIYGDLNGFISRKQCIRDLLYVLGVESSVGSRYYESVPFNDIDSIQNFKFCYDGYIIDAYNLGLIKGYSDGSARPNDTITRAEAVALIERALSLKEEGFESLGPDIIKGLSIEYRGDVSKGFYPDVVSAISEFPKTIIDKFILDGGKIVITNESPSLIYGADISNAAGMYDGDDIVVYGFNNGNNHSFAFTLTDSLIHELGHYVYFEVLSDEDRQEISRIYNEGLEVQELKGLLEDTYCNSSVYEYFAELVQYVLLYDIEDDSVLKNSRAILSKYF